MPRRPFRVDTNATCLPSLHAEGRRSSSVPDVSRDETKLWFYFLARSYLDAGCEAIHYGQVELMNGNDPNWGRIVSAAGYIGVPFDPDRCMLTLQGARVFAAGRPAGFDPAGMPAFLRRILREQRLNPANLPPYFLSHPLTEDRVAALEHRLASLPRPAPRSGAARCGFLAPASSSSRR